MKENIKYSIDENELKNVKVIFCDIDGTLINSNNELDEKTIESVNRIKDKIPFCLVSGRISNGMFDFYKKLNLTTPIFSLNGAVVLTKCKKRLFNTCIDKSLVEDVYRFVKAYFPMININVYDEFYWYTNDVNNEYVKKEEIILKFPPIEFDDINEFERQQIFKILLLGPTKYISEVYEQLCKRFNNLSVVHNNDNYIEILNPSVNKGNAIERYYKEYLKISKENTICFGDSLIDLEMFEKCGIPVAVSNSLPIIKENAKIITLSNNELGVKLILDKIGNEL